MIRRPIRRGHVVVSIAFSALACAGWVPPPKPEATVAEFPAPSSGWLLQTSTGLFASDGTLLAPLGGSFGDLSYARGFLYVHPETATYGVDASAEVFFLLSDDANTVRVARRTGSHFTVDTILNETRVLRPIGSVALVRDADGTDTRVIDATGATLIANVEPSRSYHESYGPEWWWDPDPWAQPAALCRTDVPKRQCGWVDRTGAWIGDAQWFRSADFVGGYGSTVGDTWIDASGTPFADFTAAERAGVSWVGPPTEEGVQVVGYLDLEPFPHCCGSTWILDSRGNRVRVVDSVKGDVPERVSLDDKKEGMYRFHEGMAPMWVEKGPPTFANEQAYVGVDGKIAIAPEPCDTTVPSGPFHDGRAFRCEGTQFWLVDATGAHIAGPWDAGKELAPQVYEDHGLFFSEGLAAVPIEDGWQYIDTSGAVVLAGPFWSPYPSRWGWVRVTRPYGETVYLRHDGTEVATSVP